MITTAAVNTSISKVILSFSQGFLFLSVKLRVQNFCSVNFALSIELITTQVCLFV